jgi:hypothetical protein
MKSSTGKGIKKGIKGNKGVYHRIYADDRVTEKE